MPIFIGHFEELVYGQGNGHFQAVVPYRDNNILKYIRENGGYDVAAALQFEGEHYSVPFFIYFDVQAFNQELYTFMYNNIVSWRCQGTFYLF